MYSDPEVTRAPRTAPIRDPPPSRWASVRGRACPGLDPGTPLAEADQADPPEPAFDAWFLDSMPDTENPRQDLGG